MKPMPPAAPPEEGDVFTSPYGECEIVYVNETSYGWYFEYVQPDRPALRHKFAGAVARGDSLREHRRP